MRLRTLLAVSTAGALLAGLPVGPSSADPGAVPDQRSGDVEAWGAALAAEAATVPASLDGERIVSVAASTNGTAAVTTDGELVVWGKPSATEVAAAPAGLTGVASASLNSNTGVALKQDGSVVGWGNNGVDAPPAGLKASAVSAGNGKGYAIVDGGPQDGTLVVWGTGADPAPPVDLGDNLVDITSSGAFVLALRADGTARLWGGLEMAAPVPAEIQGHISQITGGGAVAGAILDDGSVRLWGFGAPVVPAGLAGKTVTSLDAYPGNAIAATDEGEIFVWGSTAELTTVPPSVNGAHVAAVTMGQSHAAVILTDFRAVTAPAITGAAKVGQTLTATPAELSLEPDSPATGQWLADGDPIAGADSTTLELDEDLLGSMISYQTTATRGADDVESTSTEVGPVTPATVASTTTLSVAPASGGYGAARTATATVAAPDGTPTGSVTFTLDGKTATASLSGGKATWKLPSDLAVGAHTLSASYAGDSATDPSASTATTVTVTKAGSTLKARKAKVKGKTKAMAKRAVLNLDVLTDTGTSAAGTVTLKLKAKGSKARQVTVIVGADGVAAVKLKKLKRGTYKATWTYAGSATVEGSTLKVKVKV